jgi:hypothetical protein
MRYISCPGGDQFRGITAVVSSNCSVSVPGKSHGGKTHDLHTESQSYPLTGTILDEENILLPCEAYQYISEEGEGYHDQEKS